MADPSTRFARLLASATALLLAAGCASVPTVRLPSVPFLYGMRVKTHDPFVIARSKKSYGFGYLTHPWIWYARDDLLVVTYNTAGDGGGRPVQELQDKYPAVSRDGGKTWVYGFGNLHAAERFPGPVQIDGRNGSLHLRGAFRPDKNGRLVNKAAWVVDGKSSGDFQVVARMPDHLHGVVRLGLNGVELPGGDLLLDGYVRKTDKQHWRTVLLRSTDRGRTFIYDGDIANIDSLPWGWGGEGPNESAMAQLRDGDLLCVMRVQGGGATKGARSQPMLQARSSDGGKTWSYRQSVPGVMPKMVQMSNGVLVLAFGRPGNNLIFSTNGGTTWHSEKALTAVSVNTSGYVDIAEVSPGRLFVVYDLYNTPASKFWLWDPPPPVDTVYGRFIDITYSRGQNPKADEPEPEGPDGEEPVPAGPATGNPE